MKYCTHCGKPVNPKAVICPYCGATLDKEFVQRLKNHKKTLKNTNFHFWWFLISLFIPPVGLIVYFIWHHSDPGKAKSGLTGCIVGLILIACSTTLQDFWSGFFQGFSESFSEQ